ncbi:type VI secretion system baseplate subunit TssG [Chitinibacter sp. ZOR0017]|uniref:type VI secretion system baseplate subunit TssG n=1 Tax=Chitinibacter sp. ZOR0017 TaxID=1339254 RepID=UPI0006477287|nr:type VI secretion system baseplate subunit TssG [Chitinibacter sp. ZOR0017]
MASPRRRSPRHLTEELSQDPTRYSFFQAVRILGLSQRHRTDKRGALPPKLRFRTVGSLSFPPSELTRYTPSADENTTELQVAFMGLTGPSGALPTSYTELLIERKQQYRDTSLHAFFDLFSHRAIALFFGAWRKYRFWLHAEAGERDGFTRNLLDLAGLGLDGLRSQLGKTTPHQEQLFIYYAGLLSQKPMSSQALVTLIEGFFGVRAELTQFAGQWMQLPVHEQSQLGLHCNQLGIDTFAGDRIWDRQTKIELKLGPLQWSQYQAMQPNGAGAAALQALLKFALGHGLACDVTLELEQAAIPAPQLDAQQPQALGLGFWLGPRSENAKDVKYQLLR